MCGSNGIMIPKALSELNITRFEKYGVLFCFTFAVVIMFFGISQQ